MKVADSLPLDEWLEADWFQSLLCWMKVADTRTGSRDSRAILFSNPALSTILGHWQRQCLASLVAGRQEPSSSAKTVFVGPALFQRGVDPGKSVQAIVQHRESAD
jgi:hypothetical protein